MRMLHEIASNEIVSIAEPIDFHGVRDQQQPRAFDAPANNDV